MTNVIAYMINDEYRESKFNYYFRHYKLIILNMHIIKYKNAGARQGPQVAHLITYYHAMMMKSISQFND